MLKSQHAAVDMIYRMAQWEINLSPFLIWYVFYYEDVVF